MLSSLHACPQLQTHAFLDLTDDFGGLKVDALLLVGCGENDALFEMFNTDVNNGYRSIFRCVCEEEMCAMPVDVLLRLCSYDVTTRVLTHGSFRFEIFFRQCLNGNRKVTETFQYVATYLVHTNVTS